MIREYNYRCKDHSILTPYLKKYLVVPLIMVVPFSLPANLITIYSNLFVYFSVVLAMIFGSEFAGNFIIIPLFLIIYLIGDHLDGLQAKRTKTSSALGEFCDHFLNTFNNGLILVLLFFLFNIENIYLITYLLGVSYLAHASVFFHQFSTGWLVFEKIGSLEAMAATIGLLVMSFIPGVYDFLVMQVYGFKIIEYILLLSSLGAIGTILKSLIESKRISFGFISFMVLWIIFSIFLMSVENHFFIYSSLVLYGNAYIGTLMRGHLVNGNEAFPDILSVLILGMITLGDLNSNYLFVLLLFLILRTCWVMIGTFYRLGEHWVWTNPKLDGNKD